jgi:hypothetical protein
MKFLLPYDKKHIQVEIDDQNFAGSLVSRVEEYKPGLSQAELVEASLDHPIGSPRLEELAKGKKNIVIISSDHTRPVPSKIITPILLRRIRSVQPDADIKILVATGFHRPSTHEELVDKYGQEIVDKEQIVMHISTDDSAMVKVGTLPSGGECIVNRVAAEADLLISQGFIEPLKRRVNPTRVPIEKKESIRWLENLRQSTELLADPGRCVHIGDRESDIYELFCLAQHLGTHFLVRTCVDRRAGDGEHTVRDAMKQAPVRGLHRVQVRNKQGELSTAVLEIRCRRMVVRPPIGKQKDYPELILTAIHASERDTPKDREKIDWKLLTDLPVRTRQEAAEKLDWYAQRWKIETFHKILKSGCRAEEAKLRTAERLVNLIAILTILSWRIFWITMLNRTRPDAAPTEAFTDLDQYLLDELVPNKHSVPTVPSLGYYIVKLARLGGYLARAHDPPPGNTVIWRGLSRLTDIELGIMIGVQLVGN